MKYSCKMCGKSFQQKNDLRRHANKKNPCVTIEKQNQDNKSEQSNKLFSKFKTWMDDLRNDPGQVIGKDALDEFVMIILWVIVDKLSQEGKLDFDLKDEDSYKNMPLEDDLEMVSPFKFLEWAKKNSHSAITRYEEVMEFLSSHKTVSGFFNRIPCTRLKSGESLINLLTQIGSTKLLQMECDVLGEAYEKVFSNAVYGGGSSIKSYLGQFFTPPNVVKYMISELKPKMVNGEFESVLDPAAGTGGFLIHILKKYFELGKEQGLTEKEVVDRLHNKINGTELHIDTYRLLQGNVLTHTGCLLPNVINGDSLLEFKNHKVDIILANPPFSVKVTAVDIAQGLKDNVDHLIPIQVGKSSSEVQFLQMMINSLKVGGRAAVVMLDGEKLSGTTSGFPEVREMLVRQCELQKVVSLPAGTFTHTGARTAILIFKKKYETPFVWEGDIILRKKGKVVFDEKKVATKEVAFCDYHEATMTDTTIRKVPVEDIIENKYVLNISYYPVEEEDIDWGDVKMMKLGDVCDIKIGGTPSRSIKEYFGGPFPWVSIGDMKTKTINNTKECLTDDGVKNSSVKLLPKGSVLFSFKLQIGKVSINTVPVYTNEAIAGLNTLDTTIVLNSYLYYALLFGKHANNATGCIGRGSLNLSKLKHIQIPVPPLETQEKIIKELDQYNDQQLLNLTSVTKAPVFNLLLLGDFKIFHNMVRLCEYNNKLENDIQWWQDQIASYLELKTNKYSKKTLKDLVRLNPSSSIKGMEQIHYIDISGINGNNYATTVLSNSSSFPSRAKRVVQKNDILLSTIRPNLKKCVLIKEDTKNLIASTGFCQFRCDSTKILPRYLQLILLSDSITEELVNKAAGAQYPSVNTESVSFIKIPVPPLSTQKEIVERCDEYQQQIDFLEKEIKRNETELPELFEEVLSKFKKESPEEEPSVTHQRESSGSDNEDTSGSDDEFTQEEIAFAYGYSRWNKTIKDTESYQTLKQPQIKKLKNLAQQLKNNRKGEFQNQKMNKINHECKRMNKDTIKKIIENSGPYLFKGPGL